MEDPLLVLVAEPVLEPVAEPVREPVFAAVEPLPLAPVVAAAPASIESTSVIGMKLTSVPVRTSVVTVVVMAVSVVETSLESAR